MFHQKLREMQKNKMFYWFFGVIILYVGLSLLMMRGDFVAVHYYSYDDIEECKEKHTLVSNDLKMWVEGDSLRQVAGLKKKFFSCKSMYETFYGLFIYSKNENKEFRRIKWDEPLGIHVGRNWIVTQNGKYRGEAFYVGSCDVKIGDTLRLDIQNAKTDYKIGTIKILVE